MTSYAIFCFPEHTFLLSERQKGYYISRRDKALSVPFWFQFLVLVSLFPHDDRSWKCTQALDPEGQRWGWEGKEEEDKRKRRTHYAPELSQLTIGSYLGCRGQEGGQQVIHNSFPPLSPQTLTLSWKISVWYDCKQLRIPPVLSPLQAGPTPSPIMYNTFTNNRNLFKKATG